MRRMRLVECWQVLVTIRVDVDGRLVALGHALEVRQRQILEARVGGLHLLRREEQGLMALVVK